jgi:hypothetical protein
MGMLAIDASPIATEIAGNFAILGYSFVHSSQDKSHRGWHSQEIPKGWF